MGPLGAQERLDPPVVPVDVDRLAKVESRGQDGVAEHRLTRGESAETSFHQSKLGRVRRVRVERHMALDEGEVSKEGRLPQLLIPTKCTPDLGMPTRCFLGCLITFAQQI